MIQVSLNGGDALQNLARQIVAIHMRESQKTCEGKVVKNNS